MNKRKSSSFEKVGLTALVLFSITCGQSEQTGAWIRIVSPNMAITHVQLEIYDIDNISQGPVVTATVPDPPYQVPRKLFPTATDEKNQLWVLVLAGDNVNRAVRVVGHGMLEDRRVAEGEIPRIEFAPGRILDGVDAEGRSLLLELRGCTDEDGDGFCPPDDCDDRSADINPDARELCDELDNDCDMAVDEGCSCTGEGRQCRPQWIPDIDNLCTEDKDPRCPCKLGFQPCTGGTWGECEGMVPPQPEGRTSGSGSDEVGISCTEGCFDVNNEPAECGMNDFTCYLECFDGWDNDCDWRIDEKDIGCGGCDYGDDRACYEGETSTIGKGICKVGHQVCDDQGNWGECTGAVYPEADPEGPEPECDGRDEDCDGTIDDGDMCHFPNGIGQCIDDPQSPTGKACHLAGCEEGFADCDGGEQNGCEINLNTDAGNCGSCGFACGENAHCNGGACECDMNRGNCDATWDNGCEIDFLSDSDNCGSCGFDCGQNAHCSNGACVCEQGFGNCNGDWSDGCEIDIMNDAANCGSCGNGCDNPHGTTSCSGGVCQPVCEGLWGDCDTSRENGCETPLNTLDDCGQCGRACNLAHATESCSTGTCVVVSCDSGWGNCNGMDSDGCENSLDSLTDCGACGQSCSRANATASCSGDTCHIASCNSGWGDCNGVDSDGCENSLDSLTDCGACGQSCSRANATASCAGDFCHIASCNSGWGNCNGIDSDGCETNLNTTSEHCGSCGFRCNQNATCSSGTCQCISPYDNCNGNWSDGCETNLLTDPAHCGDCSTNCGPNSVCNSGTCGCRQNFANCNGTWSDGCEVNLLADPAHCGNCSNNCGSHSVCNSGSCGCQAGWANCNSSWSDGCETPLGTANNCQACNDRCDDGNPCTDDTCSSYSTGCRYQPNSLPCDDGDPCTVNDTCSNGSCTGTPKNCSDGNPCTDDSCNPSNGDCVHTNNTVSCDDGNACTINDRCSNGSCSGSAITCNDNNPCTDDTCNPASGCVFENNSNPCNDGDPCTVNDTCNGGACSGSPKDCNDNNPCTDDSCNPADGSCVHTDNTALCDDGDPCTVNDTCSNGSCVGSPITCGSHATCVNGQCQCIPPYEDCDGDEVCECNLASYHCEGGICQKN